MEYGAVDCIICGKEFTPESGQLVGKFNGRVGYVCHRCVVPNTVSPGHYKTGGIECIDYMRAKMTSEQFEGYCLGNVIKYVSRYRDKNGVEDLKKASVYLNWLIEEVKKR